MTLSEHEITRLQGFTQARRHAAALEGIEPLLARYPAERQLLYLGAVNLRHLSRVDDALELLRRLEQHHPSYSRLYEERGHCYVALTKASEAIEAFQRAVSLNQALSDSWRVLRDLFHQRGDGADEAIAAEHVTMLENLPSSLVEAGGQFSDGDFAQAERTLHTFVRQHGSHPEALRLLARIAVKRDALEDAEGLLRSVLEQAPDYGAARADYAGVLYGRQKYRELREQMTTLLQQEPGNREHLKLYAAACVALGEYEPIIKLYRRMLAQGTAPGTETSDLHLWLADLLKTVGRRSEAIEEYRSAIAASPDSGAAWWSLSNLKTYRFDHDEIARMRAVEAAPATSRSDRYHLCFALGKALEDREQYGESWAFYDRGNALKHTEIRHRPELLEAEVRSSSRQFTKEFFLARRAWGNPSTDPIFIVGLPRSGSTLIEQILASHSQVEGTHELPEMQRIVEELCRGTRADGRRYTDLLAELSSAEYRLLGERYLAETRVYRRTGRPLFIDKMPNNFRHIGLIALMMPNAKIIDVRRAPMASCFGMFKQLFFSGQEFSYSVEDLAHYYRCYLDLMRHWHTVLPGRILTVHYEDVVDDLQGSVRRLLDYCGVPFESACLDFHDNRRNVRTASSEQVRQPIGRSGIEQWHHYEPWLDRLRSLLGDALSFYR